MRNLRGMRTLIPLLMMFSTYAWAQAPVEDVVLDGPGKECVPSGTSLMEIMHDTNLGELIRWAYRAFCRPIVAPARRLHQSLIIETSDKPISAAEQQRRFRVA